MKVFKAFIKPYEAPQSVKIKILLNVFSSFGIGTGRINILIPAWEEIASEQFVSQKQKEKEWISEEAIRLILLKMLYFIMVCTCISRSFYHKRKLKALKLVLIQLSKTSRAAWSLVLLWKINSYEGEFLIDNFLNFYNCLKESKTAQNKSFWWSKHKLWIMIMNWHFFPSQEWFADGDRVANGVLLVSGSSRH